MYEKNKLSEQAQKVEDALKAIPPKYDVADEILSHYSVTAEELSRIACNLLDECLDEQEPFDDSLTKLIEDNSVCSNIYKIMQYLFSKGYNPNLFVDDERAIDSVIFLTFPDGLAPRLMRLFLENGADPNLPAEERTLFEALTNWIDYNEYMIRPHVYCWLILMAYGARLGEEKYLPITMHNNLDVSIFKRFEDYSYYEIIPTKPRGIGYGYWKMLIYDTMAGDEARLVASYGDVNGEELPPTESSRIIQRTEEAKKKSLYSP